MPAKKNSEKTRKITANIRAHYVDNARELPWRVPPQDSKGGILPNPYHVWLSEIMLQQTTVAAVKAYFEKFTSRWPTIHDLAAADEADIMSAWAGLGYYARARNLYKCANYIVNELGGKFPPSEAALLKLPGIGPYTAAAIAAIAFGQRAVVVDANIERLVARLFAIATPLPAGKTKIREQMDCITPNADDYSILASDVGASDFGAGDFGAGDFAQACMDMGATICTARNPKCDICPVGKQCAANMVGQPEQFPVKTPKKAKPLRKGRFFWIEKNEKLLLVQRPAKGMLAGMRAIPDDDWAAGQDGDAEPPFKGAWDVRPDIVQHSFTHFTLDVDLAVLSDETDIVDIDKGYTNTVWWPLNRIEDAGLPTLYRKVVRWKLKEMK